MAQFVDKTYLQEQFRQFLIYLKAQGIFDPDLTTINNRLDSLENRATALEGTVGNHTTSISNLSSTETSLSNRVSSLESKSDIYVGSSAPSNTSRIWVDTSAN